MKNRYVVHRDEGFVYAILDRGQLGSPVVFESRSSWDVRTKLEQLSFVRSERPAGAMVAARAAQGSPRDLLC